MKVLQDAKLIGTGVQRYCYEDPDDESKCIKVSIKSTRANDLEERYFTFLQSRGISWSNLTRFYSKEKTDMGDGLVFDLVRDFDGEVSKSIDYYIQNEDAYMLIKDFKRDFLDLKEYMFKNGVIAKDLSQFNVLYQRVSKDSGRFIIIDGLGNPEAIPVSNYIKFFQKRRITKYWDKFFRRVKKVSTSNELFHQMIREIEQES